MKNNIKKLYLIIVFAMMLSVTLITTNAEPIPLEYDKVIVVSLGDSYSAGEGIEPFYGQNKPVDLKVKDQNWLAHRSELSWPGLLEIPGIPGEMSDYWTENGKKPIICEWYFGAVSGAVTANITQYSENKNKMGYQKKEYNKFTDKLEENPFIKGTAYLPPQLEIFNAIEDPVDYVTLTLGGNDIGFADIIAQCVTGSDYIDLDFSKTHGRTSKIQTIIDNIWREFGVTRNSIKQSYMDIAKLAGNQANIIVAGYPKLFNANLEDKLISKEEAQKVNLLAVNLNREIENLINELQEDGINIHFVDVTKEFEGHEAYSENPWINPVIFGTKPQDLKTVDVTSAYSMHPNEYGAQAYAKCVNLKIKDIETKNLESKYMANNIISQNGFLNAKCELYDLNPNKIYVDTDDNLTNELIIIHGEDKYNKLVNIYTIKEDKVVTLLENQPLPSNVSDYYGHVSIAEKDGENYLVLASTLKEQGIGTIELNRNDFYKIYKYNGDTLNLIEDANFGCKYVFDDINVTLHDFNGKLNGEETTFKEYKERLSNYNEYEFLFDSSESFMVVYDDVVVTETPKIDLLGTWVVDNAKTMDETGKSLFQIAGSGGTDFGGEVNIKDDFNIDYYIGIGTGGKGTYQINNNNLNCTISNYESDRKTSMLIEIIEDNPNKIYLKVPYGGNDYVYFSKSELSKNLTYESVVGEWDINQKQTMYVGGDWLHQIFGKDIDFDSKKLRLYEDRHYEYDDLVSNTSEIGVYEIKGQNIIFDCENNSEPKLKDMSYSVVSQTKSLEMNYNDTPIIYYLSTAELTEREEASNKLNDGVDSLLKILKGQTSQTVLWSEFDDFDGDGLIEGFALTGSESEWENNNMWFLNEKMIKNISSNTINSPGEKWIVNNQKILYFYSHNMGPTGKSNIYIVNNGELERVDLDIGDSLIFLGKDQFVLNYSDTDAILNYGDRYRSGRTSKTYYLYFKNHSFHEFGGIEINESELKEFDGAKQVLNKINSSNDTKITNIFYRSNGVININYEHKNNQDSSTEFNNITLMLKENSVKTVNYRLEPCSFDDAVNGGSFVSAITDLNITFPDNFGE